MSTNVRLNSLLTQYRAMSLRPDADPRVLRRYEWLIEAEYRKVGKATGLNASLQAVRAHRVPQQLVPA